jgi:hypothetical protein
MFEMRNAESSTVHLAHPHASSSSDLFQFIAQTLSLPLVPYVEWEKKLEEVAANALHANISSQSAELMKQIPAIELIDLFRRVIDTAAIGDCEVMGVAHLRVEAAVHESVSLRDARPLGVDDALLWIKYWKEIGFIP